MTQKEYTDIAKNYKRKVAGSFMLVDGDKLIDKVAGEDIVVTKKLDGALQVLFYEEGGVFAVSTNGIVRRELPCIKEFAELSAKSGYKSMVVAAELYATLSPDGRERVGDVSVAEANQSLNEKLKLGVFDIISLDGVNYSPEHYKETIIKINELFSGKLVHPVASKNVTSKQAVGQLFQDWVIAAGAEGLVVHTELPIIYKIKRRHTVDAVIIGYTVGEDDKQNSIRDILVAVMRPDRLLQQFAATGNGLTDVENAQLYQKLSSLHTESSYIETDSRNVAFHMVKPEVVVELSAIDFVSENSNGEPKMNVLLSFDPSKGYASLGSTPGVAAHSLVISRIRDDKKAEESDIRLSQLSDLCAFAEGRAISTLDLPKSEILVRRVFTKGEGAKLMIQKYIVWKTNKNENPLFPAYVLHYTDFSVGRKEQLKRDIRVSNNKEQIMKFLDQFIVDNVKKGWEEVLP